MPPKKKAPKKTKKSKNEEVINTNVCAKCGIILPSGYIAKGDLRFCSPGCSN